jgi:hypothetical protein
MVFNIYLPTNITNLFRNWLYGVEKKENTHIRVGVYAYYGPYGMSKMNLSLTK